MFGQPQGQTQSAFGGSAFGQPQTQPQQQQQQQQQPAPGSAFSAFATSGSAFGAKPAAAPAAAPTAPPAAAQLKKGLDFANAKYNYRPGLIPHDTKLPPNYTALLPEATLAAFKAMSFEWGKVPVWIPPVEVRVKHVGEALFS